MPMAKNTAVNEDAVARVTTVVSPRPVADTVARLTGLIAEKGMKTIPRPGECCARRGGRLLSIR